MANLKPSAQRIQTLLQSLNILTQVIEFKEPTRTAQEAAHAIGCQVAQIVKTLIFKETKTLRPVCLLVSGTNLVNLAKVAIYLGSALEKPNAEYVLTHTSFAIGGVPPIGYSFEIKPFIDKDLLQFPEIWAAAGTPHSVFSISITDLLSTTQGIVIDLKA